MSKLALQKIASRYAKAFYETATEQGTSEAVKNDVLALTELFERDSNIALYLSNPLISADEKAELLNTKLVPQLKSATAQNTLKLLSENNRIQFLPEILAAYTEVEKASEGVVDAEVVIATTASALPEKTLNRLQGQLESIFKLTQVNLTVIEDPSILAGAIVRIRGKVIDGSYLSKLTQVRQQVG